MISHRYINFLSHFYECHTEKLKNSDIICLILNYYLFSLGYYLVNKAKQLLKFGYSERATNILPIFHLKCQIKSGRLVNFLWPSKNTWILWIIMSSEYKTRKILSSNLICMMKGFFFVCELIWCLAYKNGWIIPLQYFSEYKLVKFDTTFAIIFLSTN